MFSINYSIFVIFVLFMGLSTKKDVSLVHYEFH
jgi:hypothetical protein